MIFDYSYSLLLAIAALAAAILVLAYRMSRRAGGTTISRAATPLTEVTFIVLVALGAVIAPQLAAVLLLAGIYQQLVVMNRRRD